MDNLRKYEDVYFLLATKCTRAVFYLLIALFVASSASAREHSQNAPTKPQQETCMVSGMVVKFAGSEPLKSANVRLINVEDGARADAATTDGAGRFAVKNVERGRYRLRVTRNGFVTEECGQKTPNDTGSILTLTPGQQVKELIFRLILWSVITGHIRDEDS